MYFIGILCFCYIKYPEIQFEKFYVGFGEDMNEIDSESFDVVVTGLVGCSVGPLEQMLKEIKRVLVPVI